MTKNKPFCEDSSVYLNDICTGFKGLVIPEEEALSIKNDYKSSSTFGNTGYDFLRLVITHCNIGEDDIFLDLGAGIGKPVFQIAMETNVKEAKGIELSLTRLIHAKDGLKKLQEKGLKTKIDFIHDTFLNLKHWKGATVVYSWACCFTQLLPDIAKLAAECETLKYIALHDCSFEEIGVDLKAHKLERHFAFEREPKQPKLYRNRLYIYRKIKE